MTERMKTRDYDPEAKCPKCGYEKVRTLYEPVVHWADYSRDRDRMPTGEHLRRVCERCGYFWPERCVKPVADMVVDNQPDG